MKNLLYKCIMNIWTKIYIHDYAETKKDYLKWIKVKDNNNKMLFLVHTTFVSSCHRWFSINNCSYSDLKTIVFLKKESFGFFNKKNAHRFRLLYKVISILKTGSALKKHNGLTFNFISLTFCSHRQVNFRILVLVIIFTLEL